MVGQGHFIEVLVDTPIEVCESRDTKGMYALARMGKIKNFTGVDDAYEPPIKPELAIETVGASAEENAARILSYLAALGFVCTSPTTELKRLADLDEQLKARAKAITLAVGRRRLNDWREALCAPPAAWWWSLHERVPDERPISATIIDYLLWILIAVLFSFILEILRRFLRGGTDLPSTVVQGLLALLATGTVVQGVKQFVVGSSTKPDRLKGYFTRRVLISAVAALVALSLLMEWARPKVAGIYNNQGAELYEKRQLTYAIQKYQRAISLEPAFAQAHFNMGNAYEDVLDYEKAIGEYELSIMSDHAFYRPYNNLARLYILHRGQPLKALQMVDAALALPVDPQDDEKAVKYRLYKNRGWANLGLKNYQQARVDLERALEFVSNGADARCLMAQVLDAQKDAAADGEWVLCKTLADQQPGEAEANWSGLALERMKTGRPNK
jgi:tetratricopeptide (TPR) repeat protein